MVYQHISLVIGPCQSTYRLPNISIAAAGRPLPVTTARQQPLSAMPDCWTDI